MTMRQSQQFRGSLSSNRTSEDSLIVRTSNLQEQFVINVQTTSSNQYEVACFIVIDPRVYEMESIFATSSSNINERTIKFWDINLMKCLFEVPKQGFGCIVAMAYCAKSRTFITASFSRTIAIYRYDPINRQMKLSYCFLVKQPLGNIDCYQDMLFYSIPSENQIVWFSLKQRKIIKTFKSESQLSAFKYIPERESIAWNEHCCSFIRLRDSQIEEVYYVIQDRLSSPLRRHHKTEGLVPLASSIPRNLQGKDVVRIPSPILIKNGVGTGGITQTCQQILYEPSLSCVVFVFIDFIVFYSLDLSEIICVLKDLVPILSVRYSSAHDLLIVQCSEGLAVNNEAGTNIYLYFQREDRLISSGIEENFSYQSPFQFNKLSCQKFPASRSFYFIDSYLLMDSYLTKGAIFRRRLALGDNKQKIISSSKTSNIPTGTSSRKVSRFALNNNNNGSPNENCHYDSTNNAQPNSFTLETVEEESHLNQYPQTPSKKQLESSTSNQNSQEKYCRCAIF